MRLIDIVARYFRVARRVIFAAEGAAPVENNIAGYRFVEFKESDLDAEGLFQQRDRPTVFVHRLQDGHRLFGWRDSSGAVAGYLWLSTSQQPPAPWILGLKLALGRGQSYVWDCRTADGHRRRGLYREGLMRLRKIAAGKATQRVFIDCELENIASRSAIERAGFVSLGDVKVQRIGSAYLMRNVVCRTRLCRRQTDIRRVLG